MNFNLKEISLFIGTLLAQLRPMRFLLQCSGLTNSKAYFQSVDCSSSTLNSIKGQRLRYICNVEHSL